jgi:phage FluMu gp28-like protein
VTSTASRARLLLPYQRRWLNDTSPRKLWLAARQVGKSFALSLEAVNEALARRCDNLLLSSSERQSRELMRKVKLHLRSLERLVPETHPVRESAEEVLLSNGSRVISLPANPDTVRGFSGHIYLDEFAFHSGDREIWRAMYPTVTRGFKVRMCSTPNGRGNMFFDLWSRDEGFSRHRTDLYDAQKEGMEVDIEGLREAIGDDEAWAQEFECRFLDGETAFIPYGMISACESEGATAPGDNDTSTLATSSVLFLGVDVGRRHDLTVLWLLERVGDVLWTRMVREMKDAPFAAQREVLHALIKMPGLKRCAVDSTGIGAQLAEEAQAAGRGRVEQVSFTASVKEDLALTLRRAFEDRALRIPASPEVREDIHSVRRTVTSAGNLRFEAARGGRGHADRFWALALAVHAATPPKTEPVAYEPLATRRGIEASGGCF